MSTTIESQSSGRGFAPDVLRVELLGGFRLSYGSRSVDDSGWRLAKARSLIKLLALTPGHTMHRDQLLEHLWPDLDPDSAMNNLHQVLHVARRTLTDLIPDSSGTQVLRLRRQVLSLEPPGALWVDVEAFEEFSSRAAETAEPDYYYRAIDLYQGELLPEDLYEDWADEHRTFLNDQYLAALSELAALHENRAEYTPAIDILRRITVLDQAHEQASASLIRLYALTGRRQQALRQYERLTQALEREVGVEPDDETTALYQAIVEGTFPPASAVPAAPATVAERPAPAAEIPEAAFERSPDFVGREAEILRLIQNLDRTVAGQGQIAMMAGEPGIGKTRIIEEFARYARARNVAVYWGRSYDGEGAPAYWPWVQIIRDYIIDHDRPELESMMGPGAADISKIVPELRNTLPDLESPPELDPDGERFRLFDSVTTFLANVASQEPLVLLLEDVHWSDRSTLLLLEFLAREVTATRILIIATYRHVEVSRIHPLTHTLGEFTRHGLDQRLNIVGLGVEEIEQYLATVAGQQLPHGLAAAVHHQSEGNPLFVREIVRLLIDEGRLDNPDDVRSWRLTIPSGIQETIALRTDGLSDNAYRILSTASVSGRDFELTVVSRVAGLDELDALDALEEAMRTGLIEESRSTSGAFRFSHAITRETIYNDLGQSRRLRMHLKTGETIEEVAGEDIDQRLSELAYHYFSAAPAGGSGKAIEYLQLAAEQAIERVSYAEGARHLENALSLTDQARSRDVNRQIQLQLALGDARKREGRPGQALDVYRRAADLARQTGDPEHLAEAVLGVASAEYMNGDLEGKSIPILEEVLAEVDDAPSLIRMRLLEAITFDLTRAFGNIPNAPERARQLSDEVWELASVIDDPEVNLIARTVRQQVMWDSLDHADRIANSSSILKLAGQLNDQQRLLQTHAWRIFDFIAVGDIDRAVEDDRAYFQIATSLRQPNNLWAATFRQAMYALLQGRFEDAEAFTKQALQLGRRHTPDQAEEVYFTQLSLIRREQGRAREVLDMGRAVSRRHTSPSNYSILHRLIQVETGEVDEPTAELDRLVAGGFELVPRNLLWLPNIALLSLLSAYLQHTEAASQLLQLLQPYEGRNVSGGGNVVVYGSAGYYLGMLALTIGDWSLAERYLKSGIEENIKMRARPFEAHSRYLLGVTLYNRASSGDRERASRQIDKARAIARELGMKQLERSIAGIDKSREGAVLSAYHS